MNSIMVYRIPNFVSESISLPVLAAECESIKCRGSGSRLEWSHSMYTRLQDNYTEVLRFEANRNGCDNIDRYITDRITDNDHRWLKDIYGVHYLRRSEYIDNFDMDPINILVRIQQHKNWVHSVLLVNPNTLHLFKFLLIRTKNGVSVSSIFARHSDEVQRLSEFTLNDVITA